MNNENNTNQTNEQNVVSNINVVNDTSTIPVVNDTQQEQTTQQAPQPQVTNNSTSAKSTPKVVKVEHIKEVVKEVGFIAGVINCAGVSSITPLKLIKETDMTAMIQSNIYSALFLTKEICRMGHYDKAGTSIIFLSSIMGLVGDNAKTMYSLTKGALQSACRSLAIELAPKKIRVNCVAPGAIMTPINANLPHMADPEKRAVLEAKHPLGLGETSDISNACIYLLSDAARWVTGQTIAVDGGYTAY